MITVMTDEGEFAVRDAEAAGLRDGLGVEGGGALQGHGPLPAPELCRLAGADNLVRLHR